MPQTGDGNSTLSPRELRRFRRFEFFGIGDPRIRRGGVGTGLADLLNPKTEVFKAKRHRAGKKQRRIYFGAYSRHRVRDLDSGLYINKRHDRTVLGTTTLGVTYLKQNGQTVPGSRNIITAGSDSKPSLHLQETWDQTNPGPPFVSGGPFRSIVYNLPASRRMGFGRYGGFNQSSTGQSFYEGQFVDNGFWLGQSYDSIRGTSFANFANLSEFDSLAWDKLKPTIPKAGLAQFIYELKDLPGQLKTSAELFNREWISVAGSRVMVPIMRPTEAADHFLNHNFGWVPFISDIMKLFDVWNNTVTYIANLVRDNGIWVKRRRILEESESFSSEVMSGVDSGTTPSSEMRDSRGFSMCNPLTIGSNTQRGFCFFRTITKRTVWASGEFKYYRPEFDMTTFDDNSFQMWNTAQRLLTLYGARITPTLLYKITPWTWAIDWFTGLGNHIQRLDDFVQDGIVSRGLYVMETLEKVMTKTSLLNFIQGPVTLQMQRQLLMKQRKLADSPYGFNTPWQNLSAKQWAILGAIGISRSNPGYISHGA